MSAEAAVGYDKHKKNNQHQVDLDLANGNGKI